MTVNQALREAILPLVPVCEPDDYGGDALEYCTFAYDDQPDLFADGTPHVIVHAVILNWYLPKGVDPIEKKREICRALCAAGFTYPYVTNLSDAISQRYSFEFECTEGEQNGEL